MPSPTGTSFIEIDEERKRELMMEKKIRAASVTILPRSGGYFNEPNTPVKTQRILKTPTPEPAAVEKAKNPIALRYWNQCLEKSSSQDFIQESKPSIVQQNEKFVSKPMAQPAPVKRVNRSNTVKEACGNINRFITMDQIKKSDSQKDMTLNQYNNGDCNDEMRKGQKHKLQTKSNFRSQSASRVGCNSPKPFRRELSETRELMQRVPEVNVNHIFQEVIPRLNENQKVHLAMSLLDQLPDDLTQTVLARKFSAMKTTNLHSVLNYLPDETVNMTVALLFPKAKDDVKLSLIMDSVPKLTKLLRK